MAINFYAMYIHTDKLEEVKEFLANWLSNEYGKEVRQEAGQDSGIPFFENEQPKWFAVTILPGKWISVLHDAYEPPFGLASKLSAQFSCTAIQVMGQSTVDTYCLSVHEDGQMSRMIRNGEDTDGVEQEGMPFPFEINDGQDNQLFDYEDIDDFCRNFDIDPLTDPSEYDDHWTSIKIAEPHAPKKKSFLQRLAGRFGDKGRS
ncbi:hypothetical protein [Bacillus sp. REN3]|uniref:hypothetical protein n=1 Tax=Bacillus sp. REN3 TaxID=2802440 RepID=UPI001AED3EE6|nr:hypothetical protein [Bacillus sp. REN3]